MTTSSLYHTQGIRGYKYEKTKRVADTEIYYIHSTAKCLTCPRCQSPDTSIVKTGKTRDIRGLCVGLKKRYCASEHAGFCAGNARRQYRSLSTSVLLPMFATPNGLPAL